MISFFLTENANGLKPMPNMLNFRTLNHPRSSLAILKNNSSWNMPIHSHGFHTFRRGVKLEAGLALVAHGDLHSNVRRKFTGGERSGCQEIVENSLRSPCIGWHRPRYPTFTVIHRNITLYSFPDARLFICTLFYRINMHLFCILKPRPYRTLN